jgi:Lon protease-like protein
MIPDYVDIPLFPLPNVTFFPQTYLPLHIFEPRYREMVANALQGDRLMGVALLKAGWQKEYFGRPPIYKTFGVGKIINHEQMEDGKYNIVLQGLWRVRLIQEFPTQAYRTGHAHVMQDPPIDDAREVVAGLMKSLHELTGRLVQLLPQTRQVVAEALAAHPHPLVMANHLTSSLVVDAYDRQSILEQDDPIRRLRLLLVQLGNIVQQLQGEPLRGELIEEDDGF